MRFPTFKAIGASIGYLTMHFATVFKILWLPFAAVTAVQAVLMPGMLETQLKMIAVETGGGDPADAMALMGPMLQSTAIIYFVTAIAFPMAIAGLLKHVLRGESPRLPFYLAFGGEEWRVLGAFIVFFIMIIVIYMAGLLTMATLGVVGGALGGPVGALLAGLAAIAILGAGFWFLMRMSLIYPAGVATQRLGIVESWNATRGAVLGLVFFWLFWGLIILCLVLVFFLVAFGDAAGEFFTVVAAGGDPNAAAADEQRRIIEAQAAMFDLSSPRGWLTTALVWFTNLVAAALWIAPGGIAWRYLAGKSEHA